MHETYESVYECITHREYNKSTHVSLTPPYHSPPTVSHTLCPLPFGIENQNLRGCMW